MEDISSLQLTSIGGFEPVSESMGQETGNLDDSKMKRPPNAFILFCIEQRTMVREENPDMPNIEISRLLAEKWKETSDEVKKPYTLKAKEQQQEFKRLHPDYKYDKAKKKRAMKKIGDYDLKKNIDLPPLETLVNMPLDELRAFMQIMQNQLFLSCQNIQQIINENDNYSHIDDFPHDVFQQGQ